MKNTDGGLCQLQLSLSPDLGKPGETAIQTVLEGQRYLALVLVSLLTGSSEDLQAYMDVCNGYWVRKRLMKSFLGKLSSLMRCWLGHRTSLSIFFVPDFLSLSVYLGHLGGTLVSRVLFTCSYVCTTCVSLQEQ